MTRLALTAFCLLMVPVPASAQERPNIILIMADDLGFADLGCYGSEIETPNLDSLAAAGLRFTQFYNTAKCHSSRVSILTGLYCDQAGSTKLSRGATIAEVLSEAGYFTAMVGKWHLSKQPSDFRWLTWVVLDPLVVTATHHVELHNCQLSYHKPNAAVTRIVSPSDYISRFPGHFQLDPHSGLTFDQHLRQGTGDRPRPERTRLETRTLICRPPMEVDFIGSPGSQGRVGTMLVVPGGVPTQLLAERLGAEGHQESSGALDLDSLDEAFHHSNAAMLSHGPKPRSDLFPFAAPVFEFLAPELLPLVTDQVLGRRLGLIHETPEKSADFPGIGFLREDGKAHGAAGEMIDYDGDPVGEGPALRQREGKPGSPEAQLGGDQGEIDVPDVIDPLGGDHATGRLIGNLFGLECLIDGRGRCFLLRRRLGVRAFFEDAADRGRAQMEAGPAEDLSDLLLSQTRAEHLQLLDEVTHQVGELVDGLGGLDQGLGACLVDSPKPGTDRIGRDQEGGGGLLGRPAPGGPKFEDGHPVGGRIVRPAGRGDDVEDGGFDMGWPAFREWNLRLLALAGHLGLQKTGCLHIP